MTVRHITALAILGIIGVVFTLIIQTLLSLFGTENLWSEFGALTSLSITTLLIIAFAAATEECVRLGLLIGYFERFNIHAHTTFLGLVFGATFGLTEMALFLSTHQLTATNLPSVMAVIALHTTLSTLIGFIYPLIKKNYFFILPTLIFLVLIHTLFNVAILTKTA